MEQMLLEELMQQKELKKLAEQKLLEEIRALLMVELAVIRKELQMV